MKEGDNIFDIKIFGKNIKNLRKHKGLRMLDISEELHITESYLGQIENGTKIPSVDISLAIVNYFGLDFEFLLQSENIQQNDNLLLYDVINEFSKLTFYEKQFVYNALLLYLHTKEKLICMTHLH